MGQISVSTRALADRIEIRIGDNGTGIPPEIQDRIFDPFFTTKEVGHGTGQGLAIAYNIVVNKHAGSITFDTEPGQGTTFIITLPLS
jgi:signal transduction histidine kinase